MGRIAGMRKGAALCAALLLAGLGLGLTACGAGGEDAVQEAPSAVQGENGSDGSQAAEESSGDDGGSARSGITGEPLPDDWPADFLVPDGEIVLVIPIGTGGSYSITVEGVDDGQARGLIDEMVSAGLTTTAGVTETGNGEWIAEVVGSGHRASYAYAGGGAGEPNVTIQLLPDA